jgi:hypothetical protein
MTAAANGTMWSFSSLSELHDRFGWEEYLVLATVLIISVLIGKTDTEARSPGPILYFAPQKGLRYWRSKYC